MVRKALIQNWGYLFNGNKTLCAYPTFKRRAPNWEQEKL